MGKKRHSKRAIARKHLDKKLLFRLYLFVVIFLVMMVILTYDIFLHTIGFMLAAGGLGLGIIIGFISGRIFVTKWHEETNKIVTRIDEIGVVVLVFYFLFAFFRNKIIGYWLHGPILTAFSFSLIAGVMLGRLLSTIRSIRNILSARGIIR